MPASISLHDLAWSTPDSRSLFANLNFHFGPEKVGLVGRNGVGKTTLLKLIAGELAPTAGNVAASGRIRMLRQAVSPTPGETIADLFGIAAELAALIRIEQGAGSESDLANADWMLLTQIDVALQRVGLDVPAETTLTSLSGGQQTRARLAALIFAEPDFLLLDEPTNNLDRDGRAAVSQLLSDWRGGAIVVSHDRELLETMDAIVELTALGAARYGGPWSFYRERKSQELAAAEQDLAHAEKQAADIAKREQASAERQARRNSAGKRSAAQGGVPRILLGARKDQSEKTSGTSARIHQQRKEEAETAAAVASQQIERLQTLQVNLASTQLPSAKLVLKVERVSFAYETNPPVIRDLTFEIIGPERVAVTGPNGCGKTTLLALIAGTVEPQQGAVRRMTPAATLDQHGSLLDRTLSIRDNFLRINPQATENESRAALAKFQFRADAALQIAGTLSGGQLLRAALACVLGGAAPVPLLILDEPTNHLDLESIAAIEAGLRAYDGALLVVSHDESFLRSIEISRRIELTPQARD
ncbi:ATP-binding cassette domain-containing protein [Blastopirellula sp. JC732]|uniref:ATP-binding cassette domain-containing protein n=1 Tax=Blastopirellula sediminis TaxID=2894196 RepID=A0A9X1MR43_9BACT|nr:ABC-F family ATP-binding cassette domain-containing protein [Blastopirellula sediminis]MCC9606624.1 ATP-binding cassette domain-containing protein [Blastopirellula sediminis]MCC9630079.1 ATP-binding cassette domain-containing protein [Blastopirellula sediminis]